MTPQLFINYKLKSVAHLPWRMMTYKALNTFIDDIFAFVIKMPTMYRIGCFRDDVVFFIFLYQRYIYKMDPTRVNEFLFLLRCWRRRRLRVLWTPLLLQLLKAVTLLTMRGSRRLPRPSQSRKRPKKLTRKQIGLGIFCCSYGSAHRDYVMMACITSKSLVDSS